MFVGFRRRCDYPDPVFRSVFAHRSPCSGTDRKGWLRKGDVSSCAPRTCAPFSVSPPPLSRFTVVPRYAMDTKDTDLAYLSSHGSVLLCLAVPMVYGCGGGSNHFLKSYGWRAVHATTSTALVVVVHRTLTITLQEVIRPPPHTTVNHWNCKTEL